MSQIIVTFAVTYRDPDSQEHSDHTRHFATEHQAREWVTDMLPRIAPNATAVECIKITTERKKAF